MTSPSILPDSARTSGPGVGTAVVDAGHSFAHYVPGWRGADCDDSGGNYSDVGQGVLRNWVTSTMAAH